MCRYVGGPDRRGGRGSTRDYGRGLAAGLAGVLSIFRGRRCGSQNRGRRASAAPLVFGRLELEVPQGDAADEAGAVPLDVDEAGARAGDVGPNTPAIRTAMMVRRRP